MTRFVLRAVFLVFATTLATVSFMTSNWVPAVASLLCIFWSIGSLWRLYSGSEQKVTRLLDAVDNNDGSFRFPYMTQTQPLSTPRSTALPKSCRGQEPKSFVRNDISNIYSMS